MGRWTHRDRGSGYSVGPRYRAAVSAGFRAARELGQPRGPEHFLIGIAEGDGAAAKALGVRAPDAAPVTPLRAAVAAGGPWPGGSMYLHIQAQEAARRWAGDRDDQVEPEHLLVALLDQMAPAVQGAMLLAGVDPRRARRQVLPTLGAPEDLPPIPMPAPTPAGTLDRPALAIAELPADVWALLQWRQQQLPLGRLRRPADWHGLSHLEWRSAWRAATRAGVNDDARCSLLHHHNEQVRRLATAAAPHLASERDRAGAGVTPVAWPTWWPPRRLRVPNAFAGWACWCKNRVVDLNAARFRLMTLHYYRGQPRARPRG